jgi:hypothetical protein
MHVPPKMRKNGDQMVKHNRHAIPSRHSSDEAIIDADRSLTGKQQGEARKL